LGPDHGVCYDVRDLVRAPGSGTSLRSTIRVMVLGPRSFPRRAT
jgi:hypothetical protein